MAHTQFKSPEMNSQAYTYKHDSRTWDWHSPCASSALLPHMSLCRMSTRSMAPIHRSLSLADIQLLHICHSNTTDKGGEKNNNSSPPHTESAKIATQTMQEEAQQNLNTAVEHSNLFTSWEKRHMKQKTHARLMLGKENTSRGLLCLHRTWCHPLLRPVLSDRWRPQCTTECCRRSTQNKKKYSVKSQYHLLTYWSVA